MKTLTCAAVLLFAMNLLHAQQDWANTAKYREANQKLLLEQPKSKGRIVLMGDSITEGWGKKDSLFFAGKPYINRGIGGQTTPQILMRFPQDVISLHPKAVVILAGTNDIAENAGPMTMEMSIDNIKKMVKLCKANKIKPILCSILPANDFPWRKGMDPADKILKFNDLLRTFAVKNKILFIDYYPLMADGKGMEKSYTDDGVHPNQKGYRVMAPILEETLSKLR